MDDDATVIMPAALPACSACGAPIVPGSSVRLCPACLPPAENASPDPAAIRIPGYENAVPISRGGMGVVYRARQIRPAREVALKVLLTHLADDPEMHARFQIEARAMASLDHPSILPVYEVGEVDGMPFFSMKLAPGGTLARRLANGPLPPREAATRMAGLCRALHCAHQHGVLHRDLKPENFLFDDEGRACISDFGLAKLTVTAPAEALTRTESFFGTPHYMPPEVAAGSVMDAGTPADIYSMGAVLYQCLSGSRPFGHMESLGALLRAIMEEAPPPLRSLRPGLPRDLEVICAKAMERSPAARYASAAELASDLERWLDGRPVLARPVGPAEALWRWARRHPLPASLAAALAITAITGGILLAISNRQRGELLEMANLRLHRSLISQAKADRLLGLPGFRQRALGLLRQAAAIAPSPEIRDEAAALLVRPDVREIVPPPALPASDFNPPPLPDTDDRLLSALTVSGRPLTFAFYESGRAALWRDRETSPVRIWNPEPGQAITGSVLTNGTATLLGGTESGLLSLSPATLETRVLLPPGHAAITGLALSPSGDRAALGTADGLQIIDTANGSPAWQTRGEPARCPPAWSPDGTVIAGACGDFRGVTLFEAGTGHRLLTIPTNGWPASLTINPDGRLLAVTTDDHMAILAETTTGRIWTSVPCDAGTARFSSSGTQLLAGSRAWLLENPQGLTEWQTLPDQKEDDTVFHLALSPDGKHLLSTATGGVRIWSVGQARQTGFHPAENQRIDAPTAAWWLDSETILVQVPGALERVRIDARGVPGPPQPVDRPAGSTVVRIDNKGTWLVRLTNDDDTIKWESWPAGDADKPTAASEPAPPSGLQPGPDGVISLSAAGISLRLTPPPQAVPRSMILAPDGRRLFTLAARHRVFAWHLTELATALEGAGFPAR